MMKREARSGSPHIARTLKYPADISLDQFGIETADFIEAKLAEELGPMTQLAINRNTGRVVVRDALIMRSSRPDAPESFNCHEHPTPFPSLAGSFSFPGSIPVRVGLCARCAPLG